MILLLPAMAPGAETICFDDAAAAALVVEVEQCRIRTEQADLYRAQAEELTAQIGLEREMVRACQAKTATTAQALEEERALCAATATAEKKACDARVKAVRPSVFRTVLGALGAVGIGILVGALLL
ncbi:MAG: hypothetical protein M0R74_15080 [Dehalococcoidia bacterium]|nr:hypothetical protein [Dehalococcoidia bacterium]